MRNRLREHSFGVTGVAQAALGCKGTASQYQRQVACSCELKTAASHTAAGQSDAEVSSMRAAQRLYSQLTTSPQRLGLKAGSFQLVSTLKEARW